MNLSGLFRKLCTSFTWSPPLTMWWGLRNLSKAFVTVTRPGTFHSPIDDKNALCLHWSPTYPTPTTTIHKVNYCCSDGEDTPAYDVTTQLFTRHWPVLPPLYPFQHPPPHPPPNLTTESRTRWLTDCFYSMTEEKNAWHDHCTAIREAKINADKSDPDKLYKNAWYNNNGDDLAKIDKDDLQLLNPTLCECGSRHKIRADDAAKRSLPQL